MSSLFCYLWVFFTNNAIMPLFLAISEDGFLQQAKNPRFSWLSEDFKDPVNSLTHEDSDEDETPQNDDRELFQTINT